jgi:hypothetical protein
MAAFGGVLGVVACKVRRHSVAGPVRCQDGPSHSPAVLLPPYRGVLGYSKMEGADHQKTVPGTSPLARVGCYPKRDGDERRATSRTTLTARDQRRPMLRIGARSVPVAASPLHDESSTGGRGEISIVGIIGVGDASHKCFPPTSASLPQVLPSHKCFPPTSAFHTQVLPSHKCLPHTNASHRLPKSPACLVRERLLDLLDRFVERQAVEQA